MSQPIPPPLSRVNNTTTQQSNKRPRPTAMSSNLQYQPPNKIQRIGPHPSQYQLPTYSHHHQQQHYQYTQQPNRYTNPQSQYYTQSQHAYRYPHRQYQPQHTYNTSQYYDNNNAIKRQSPSPKIHKSQSPVIETVLLSNNNNKLPQRLIYKIEDMNNNNNNNNNNSAPIEPMIYIGKCNGLLFGPQHNKSDAIPGDIKLIHEMDKSTHIIKVYNSLSINGTYLGQTDTKIVAIFGELLKNKNIEIRGKIINHDISKLQARLPPNRFVRKIELEILSKYEYVLNIIHKTRRKVKKWKWLDKSILLNYFSGVEVQYNLLEEFIISYLSESYNGNLIQLEANFNAAFEKDITADDLDGINPYDGIVSTKLLKHQSVGLEWMCLRENFDGLDEDDELPPFFVEKEDPDTGDIKYINIISEEEIDELPELGCGGILADDMGLGKTLQTISLIATNSGYQSSASASNDNLLNDNEYGDGPTLIVAPLTVIGNWVNQINEHCLKNSFRILIYHGSNREKDLNVIKSYNIVVTTYDIVALEYSDENDDNREEMRKYYGCGLQYINWLRIVLDEAHKIRSRKTRIFKACNALQSKSRWCLSGTPVQNRLDDLYSLFKFLKLQPICNKAFWNKFIISPLKNGQNIGFERLRKVMKQLCLRRNKSMEIDGKKIINIPEKVVKTRILRFSNDERIFYDKLMSYNKMLFNKLKQSGGDKEIMRNFSSVLSMLLRLRQCCAHIALVPNLDKISKIKLSDLNLNDLQDSNEECASCGMSPDEETILTICNHIYCKDCFLYECEVRPNGFPCFLCGDKLSKTSIKEQKKININNNDDNNNNNDEEKIDNNNNNNKKKKKKKYKKFVVPDGDIIPSTKMQSLIDDVHSWDNTEVNGLPQKAVVFSQWTSVLDLLSKCLDQENILYERLDGSMSRNSREAAMENFRNNDLIPVFLMSLKAGNLGVNMTMANHVYMLDPWWNPATEDQAVDRVYRLGQKRIVHVNHFVIKDSVEEKIIKIQERKRKLIKSALGQQSKEELKDQRKSEWLNDLKDLFAAR